MVVAGTARRRGSNRCGRCNWPTGANRSDGGDWRDRPGRSNRRNRRYWSNRPTGSNRPDGLNWSGRASWCHWSDWSNRPAGSNWLDRIGGRYRSDGRAGTGWFDRSYRSNWTCWSAGRRGSNRVHRGYRCTRPTDHLQGNVERRYELHDRRCCFREWNELHCAGYEQCHRPGDGRSRVGWTLGRTGAGRFILDRQCGYNHDRLVGHVRLGYEFGDEFCGDS
jgi:hypothetical protein